MLGNFGKLEALWNKVKHIKEDVAQFEERWKEAEPHILTAEKELKIAQNIMINGLQNIQTETVSAQENK